MAKSRLKIVVVGDTQSGKTSLLQTYTGQSNPHVNGVGMYDKKESLEAAEAELILWDMSGEARYRDRNPSWYRRANAFVMTYDITNEASFRALEEMLASIKADFKRRNDALPPIILVGTKADLVDQQKVTTEQAQAFATQQGLLFQAQPVSANTGEGVKELFADVMQACMQPNDLRASDDVAPVKLEESRNTYRSSGSIASQKTFWQRDGWLIVGLSVAAVLALTVTALCIAFAPLLAPVAVSMLIKIAFSTLALIAGLSLTAGYFTYLGINACTQPVREPLYTYPRTSTTLLLDNPGFEAAPVVSPVAAGGPAPAAVTGDQSQPFVLPDPNESAIRYKQSCRASTNRAW